MTRIRRMIMTICTVAGLLTGGFCLAEESEIICPVMDVPPRLFYEIAPGYVFPAEVSEAGAGDMGVAELDVWGELMYWENDLGSDFTLSAHWNTQMLEGYEAEESTYSLNRGFLKPQFQQRFLYGFGMILDASPGIYSALDGLDGSDFAVPCGATFVKALNPEFALVGGASFYPGFDVAIDPRLGFRWRPSKYAVLDLGYPETRFEAGDPEGARFVLGGWFRQWPEYGMGDDPRERLMFDEARGYAGIEWSVTELVQLSILGGYSFAREIEFKTGGVPIDIEDAPYVQIGLGGLL